MYKKDNKIVIIEEDDFSYDSREGGGNTGIIFTPKLGIHESEYNDNLLYWLFLEAYPAPANADVREYEYAIYNMPKNILLKYLKKHFVILPLYYYSHSGESISTTPFSCPFDSGKCGYIYARIGQSEEETEKILRWEVETIDYTWNHTPLYYRLYEEMPAENGTYTSEQIRCADKIIDGILYHEIDSCFGIYRGEKEILKELGMEGAAYVK